MSTKHMDEEPKLQSTSQSDTEQFSRLTRYYEWIDACRANLIPEAAVAFRFGKVKCLKLPHNVSAVDLMPIASMLKYDNAILALDCSHCTFGNAGAYVLADMLPYCTLRELDLSHTDIGEQGAVVLLRAVERAAHLERLYLRGNRIGIEGASALGRVLRKTKTLHYVDVSNNFLRTIGLREITASLLDRARARQERRDRLMHREHSNNNSNNTTDNHHNRSNSSHSSTSTSNERSAIPHVASGTGWGWVFGDASQLVVTNNYVVKTTWKGLSSSSSIGNVPMTASMRNLEEMSNDESSVARRLAANSTPYRSTSTNGSNIRGSGNKLHSHNDNDRGSPTITEKDAIDELDIEVKISGNFVGHEIFSIIVHAVGLILSILGAVPLLSKARNTGDPIHVGGLLIYLLTLWGWFGTALLHHSLFMLDINYLFSRLSPTAAFALIGGTYTPFLLTNYRDIPFANGLLIFVWSLALIGSLFSTMCRNIHILQKIRTFLYLILGWIALIPYFILPCCIESRGWTWLSIGGIVFTSGIAVHIRDSRKGDPVVRWYILVLAACALHFAAVYWYAVPPTESCIQDAKTNGLLDNSYEYRVSNISSIFGTSSWLDTLLINIGGNYKSTASDPKSMISSAIGASLDSNTYLSSILDHVPSPTGVLVEAAVFATKLSEAASTVAKDGRRAMIENVLSFLRTTTSQLENMTSGLDGHAAQATVDENQRNIVDIIQQSTKDIINELL